MQKRRHTGEKADITIGLDLGDHCAQLCALDDNGQVVDEGRVKLTR